MNSRVNNIVIGLGMIFLLTFLLFKTNAVDADAHLRYSNDLRQLKELDTAVDKEVLVLRYDPKVSDAGLTEKLRKIKEINNNIKNIPSFLDINGDSRLRDLIKEYSSLETEKGSVVEKFAANNRLINASVADFQRGIGELIPADGKREVSVAVHNKIVDLYNSVLEFSVSNENSSSVNVDAALLALQEVESSVRASDAEKIGKIIAAVKILLDKKPERDRLVSFSIGISSDLKLNEIIEYYQLKHYQAISNSNVYRLILYVFTVLLMAYVGYVFLRLRGTTKELNVVNENLEGCVDERTDELSVRNHELKKSEANNKALFGALPDTLWRIDKEGVFLDVITSDDGDIHAAENGWQGKNISEVLPKVVAEGAMELVRRSLATGEKQKFEFTLEKRNRTGYFESRMVVCGKEEVLVIVRDISDLKRALAESQVISEIIQGVGSASNLKELLGYIHESISRVVYAENCFVALYDPEIDKLDLQLFVDKYDPEPELPRLGKGLTAYVYRNGDPVMLTKPKIEKLVADGDIELVGTPPAVWVGIPLKTREGTIGVLVVQHYEDANAYSLHDVDLLTSVGDQIALAIERKRSENALRVSEERFQNAFEYAPIGFCVAGIDGRFLQVNQALSDIFGYSKDELLNLSFADVTGVEERKHSLDDIKKIISGEFNSFQREVKFKDRAGKQVLALTSISLVRSSTGDPLYYIVQIQDITEQKSMEDQLERAQKLESIGQLAAGIAHEINTPTQYVGDNTRFLSDGFRGYSAVLEKTVGLLEAYKAGKFSDEVIQDVEREIENADIEYLKEEIPIAIEQALHGVERISKIVQSMKDFAHPGSVDKKAADINRAIESTITVASNEWKYVADVTTNFDENLPSLPCLIGEFNQVILNMIINASHAISDIVGDSGNGKGMITVSTTRVDEWAEIRIGDTGSGMPEDVQKRIFDPFFTTKEVGRGTGQGLAISHNVIVEKHNGKIEVESEVGKGTTFIIKLPINESHV